MRQRILSEPEAAKEMKVSVGTFVERYNKRDNTEEVSHAAN